MEKELDIEKRMDKARQQGQELAKILHDEKMVKSDPNYILKHYCKIAEMQSLRTMAEQFAISNEDDKLEIVCDEIERRCVMDRNLTNTLTGNKGVENDET
jgi:vacuolar-type H+-ATPase subunit B/Vma2